MTVFKYLLTSASPQLIDMPVGAHILSVQMQFGRPCLWALVDPDAPAECRSITICGTDHDVPLGGKFIDTFQVEGGKFVFHVFDTTPK